MRIRAIVTLSILVTILIPSGLIGQISRGGVPIRISKLKSITAEDDVIIMPVVDNQQLRNSNNQPDELRLKPFRFAYTFEVDLTTKNSGNW